jgi:2-methylcitrate dehydratase PrpD
MAADLAASRVRGIAEPLEGAWSFRDLFAGESSPGYSARPIGRPLAIEQYGLKAKIHPCCASAHCALDALLALRTEYGFSAEQVECVDVLVNRMSYDNLMYADPRSGPEARFSMHWCIALGLLQGRLTLADFTAAALGRKATRTLLRRIAMHHTAAGNEHPLVDNGREPASVSVLLKDGRRLERYAQRAKGTLQAPATAAELDAKFGDCAGNRPALRAMLEGFEKLPDIRSFMRALRKSAA